MEFVRKHFKLVLIVVCGIALTAEVILLIRTFTKKPSDGKKRKYSESSVSDDGGWKVQRCYYAGETEKTLKYSCEYDDLGRLVSKAYYDKNGATVQYTEYTKYTLNGKIKEEWAPDETGEFLSACIWDVTGYYTDIDGVYETEVDEEGYYTAISAYRKDSPSENEKQLMKQVTFLYEDGGKSITKETSEWNEGGERTTHSVIIYKMDDEGRLLRAEDEDSTWKTEYQYSETETTKTDSVSEMSITVVTDKNNRETKYVLEYPYGIEKRVYYYPKVNIPDDHLVMADIRAMSDEHIDRDGTREKSREVILRPDGQPEKEIDLKSGTTVETFSYDDDGHVKGKTAKGKSCKFSLDEHGNLIESICNYDSGSSGYYYEWIYIDVPE